MPRFDSFARPIVLALGLIAGVFAQALPGVAAETRTAIVAGGCFWCVESDFESVSGVIEARSGFSGGHVTDPSYRDVTRGGTGHLEAVEITYDPARISYAQLLHLFLRSVDPTDAGGQFCDRGAAYRTAIFAGTAEERAIAEAAVAKASADLGQAIVTPVLNAGPFYPAEAGHQNYYRQTALVITRFGPRSKATAYKLYREACGRDAKVAELWGAAAPFAHGH